MNLLNRTITRQVRYFSPSYRNLQQNHQKWNRFHNEKQFNKKILFGVTIASFLLYGLHDKKRRYVYNKDSKESIKSIAGKIKEELPFYTKKDIAQHNKKESRIWVTYEQGVYDITEFVDSHPGGDIILLASGNALDPFWQTYAVHKTPEVLEILESFRIGNLKEDTKKLPEAKVNLYENEPKRHPALKPTSVQPFNAEVSPSILIQHFITPNELFYVRNHLPVPEIDANNYNIEIQIEEGKNNVLTLTLDDLKKKFTQHTIMATIMCAGNRRSEMAEYKNVKGLSWGPAAVGNAKWTGVKLSDVLKAAGIDEDDKKYKHVQFEGADFDFTGQTYGASIPFWKAIDKCGDVLLVYEMNGKPLPRDHGYPLRVVVPGIVGARNVKWLKKIIVSKEESKSHWQQNDYKGFSPSINWENVDFSKSPAIQELPVISAICSPEKGEIVKVHKDNTITVKGYAWSGGGQKIIRVDVTVDGGDNWYEANIDQQDSAEPPQHWGWTFWSARILIDKKLNEVEIWAKAVDSAYNTQPESFKNIWNLRGVLNNAYHRVAIKLNHNKS